MARFESDDEVRRLGEALARLRRERGLSQAEAGQKVGMTSQGWGLYEAGKRPGLFRPDVQRRLTAALDVTIEALVLDAASTEPFSETTQSAAATVQSRGRAFDGPFSRPTAGPLQRLRLSNDDLAPWAASGVVLEYEPGRWPRRDQGCVIEMNDGEVRVRLFERADADSLVLRGGPGGLAVEETMERSQARSVSAVVARLDS